MGFYFALKSKVKKLTRNNTEMGNNKVSENLPTELIDEKTFYTLGGASAAVLLICWAINYITVDVSWLNYKVYRFIGFILSEVFAVIIVFQKKDRKAIKWLFAFLNGLLIFVNASGLNVMTTSDIFNPKDSTNINSTSYFHFQQFRSDSYQKAGIFPLPRMASWWPDEKLMAQNARLEEQNRQLITENYKLKAIQRGTDGSQTLPVTSQNDSLRLLISQLAGKQKQIDELLAGIRNDGDKLQQQLSDCLTGRNALVDSLNFYSQKFYSCQQSYGNLMERYNRLYNEQNGYADQFRLLKEQLNDCTKEKLDFQNGLNECNNQLRLLKRQLADCENNKVPSQENTDALNNRIRELMQRIKELEVQAGSDNTTLVELFRQICAKNNMPVRVRTSVPNRLPDDNLLRNEDFYKAVDWAVFCKNFNTWYIRMSK